MPNGGIQRAEHDADGRPVRIAGADGGVYRLSWGGYGVVHEVREPTGEPVRFRYDRECNLVQVINERGEVHRIMRNVAGRVVGECTFDGRRHDYRLDNAGNIVGIRSDDGMTVELTRDPCGRVIERKYADETADRFEYHPLGRLVLAETEEVCCEFTYDARGRLLKETQTFGGRAYAVEGEYSLAGRRTALRTSLCLAARFEPNAMGLPARVLLTRAPCPNCSQLLANLHQQYGQPNPSVIQPGATSRDGTDCTNFSPPSMDWVRAQQAAIAAGRGRSGPQPPVPHTRAPDGSRVPSAVPAPTGPAYPPHSGYGTVYP
nr:hypothetical protein [Sorangium cellulosum]